MIDDVRQRQQGQSRQPKQTQEDAQGHEKKNINALKEQPPYQQKKPSVEFTDTEQPAGTHEKSREQQRAAFLEQVKKTRAHQTQRQQEKQPER